MAVEVGVREFRSSLAEWIDRAAAGEVVVVTERGRPRVRLTAATGQDIIDRLVREGRATPPTRPRRHIPLEGDGSSSPVTDTLLEQRREREY